MHEMTDKPFGMNVALAFVKGTNVIDFVIEQGIKFVTTSSGSPDLCTRVFQEAGIKVFHVVPTLDMALKALDAGVDGLVVEGGEGGGFKNPRPVSTMVLLPLIRERTEVPIIAAGGICDGPTMAAAFAMGAEGVQLGTAMLSCADSPVHPNWKNAIYEGKETDTVFLNQQGRPALRAMRTERTGELELMGQFQPFEHMANILDLYFGGDLEAAIPLTGQVMGRINEARSAAEIVETTMEGFHTCLAGLQGQYA
jgi:enoyl-[acyl-carrier protein] reductase II